MNLPRFCLHINKNIVPDKTTNQNSSIMCFITFRDTPKLTAQNDKTKLLRGLGGQQINHQIWH